MCTFNLVAPRSPEAGKETIITAGDKELFMTIINKAPFRRALRFRPFPEGMNVDNTNVRVRCC